MSNLNKLIKENCSNGIIFYKLKELVNFTNGKGHEKVVEENGKYILITSKAISSNMEECRKTNAILTPLYKDDITMVMSDLPNGRALAKCFIIDEDNKFTLNQRVCGLSVINKEIILPKFLYYILNRNRQLLKFDNGVDQTNLRKDDILNICIPVPPLEVQREIVHILDDFTLLSAELSAELKARQKQYEYYRNELVNHEKNMYLSEILKIKNGKDYKAFSSGNIPVYGSGGIMTYTSKYAYDKPSVLIPRKGSINKLYYVDTPFWNVDTIFYTEINIKIAIPKYIFYCLENEHLEELNTAGGVPSLTQTVLNKVKLYIPSLEEQKKIVQKLDKLYTLINNISEGLPAEIEARRKQYEYYRDKLLEFKELKVEK